MGRQAEGYKLIKRGKVWHIYWREEGRRRMYSTGAEDRADAEKVLASLILESGRPEPDDLTISYCLDRYFLDKTGIAAKNKNCHKSIIMRVLGDLTVSAIAPASIRDFCSECEKIGYSAGYVRRILTTLTAALNHARKDGLLTNVPFIKQPAAPPPKDRWLTRSEVALLLKHAGSDHIRRFIILALNTGQRKGAILDLTWDRVDLTQRRIEFNNPDKKKTNKQRGNIPINDDLFAELSKDNIRKGRVVQYRGKGIADVKRGFAQACKDAGLENVTPHTLKHTCGTWMAQAGVDMWMISGILGHSHSRTTGIYLKHSPDHLRTAVDKLLTKTTNRTRKGAVMRQAMKSKNIGKRRVTL